MFVDRPEVATVLALVQKLSIDVDLVCVIRSAFSSQSMSLIVKTVFVHFAPELVTTIPALVLNVITSISFAQMLRTVPVHTVVLSQSPINPVHLDLSAALGANNYGCSRIMTLL